MTPSTDAQLKDRIKRHQSYLVKMKAAKEKKNQNIQAMMEHLKLVQKALQEIGENESQGAAAQRPNSVDIRVLTASFDNLQM
ncbi:hypothetical protein CAEBREN_25941 [Caenorhabditis brenneri]|uniref:Uncharacterized protein n=1 Tax=Caenorhabditis brenneri TaxID=135651 RepID=G0N6Y1_CAEBE|nr:hypothetical protein CAEBREN_25941 [Caenorhabditis brenneri]